MFNTLLYRLSGMIKRSFVNMAVVAMVGSICSAQTVTYYQTGEEFNGPFPSWKNVKTDYGAKGDGVTDDAAAINTAINALKNTSTNTYCVLYFPAGTYKIGSTIANTGRVNGDEYSSSALIGEDPSNTILVWSGASNGAMMKLDAWNNKVSRLTFDGKSIARDGIARVGNFGTGTEISDCVFKDLVNGMNLGDFNSQGQAEHLIIRCKFYRCSDCGINCPNMNSLDEWVWYCLFEDCGYGVNPGGFQMYGNVFLRSTKGDFGMSWQPIAIVNNVSIGSTCFHGGDIPLNSAGGEVFMQGNKIYNCSAIMLKGNNVCIDNTIRVKDGKNSVVDLNSGGGQSAFFLAGNTGSRVSQFYSSDSQDKNKPYAIDNVFVDASTLPVPTSVELPATPPRVVRKIFEVTSIDNFQTQIVAACAEPAGSRPVVHVTKGKYAVKGTILVPANREISIVGDGSGGFGTSVSAALSAGTPTFKLLAPSRVTIQDMDFEGNPGIQVEVTDVSGSRVIGRAFNAQGKDAWKLANQALIVDSIDHGNLLFSGAGIQRCKAGALVRGGQDALTADGQIAFLSGASSHALSLWNVQNNGRLIAHGFWKEADITVAGKHLIDLSSASSGKIALGAMFWCDNMDTVSVINGFSGLFTNFAAKFQRYNNPVQVHRIDGVGTNSNVMYGYCTDFAGIPKWIDNTSPDANAGLMGLSGSWKKVSGALPDSATVRSNIAFMRSLRLDKPVACPEGVNDVKLLRVVASSNNGTGARFVGKPRVGVLHPYSVAQKGLGNQYMQQIVSFGKSIKIPEDSRNISAYSLSGRLIWSTTLGTMDDRQRAVGQLQQLSSHSPILVDFRK